AAKVDDGTPCCDWVGPEGAGHFVKMVHNGIEYGDMQLICEAYDVMRRMLGLEPAALHDVLARWNTGPLDSYLIEITRDILGFTLMNAMAKESNWEFNNGGVALMWRGGCIIRSAFLGRIKEAFDRNPKLANLLLDPYFSEQVSRAEESWRRVCAAAITHGIP